MTDQFLNCFHWQQSVTAHGGKAYARSAQRRTEFYLGCWQIANAGISSLPYARCNCCSENNPLCGEFHLKFGLQGTKNRPQTVCVNLSDREIPLLPLGGWFDDSLLSQWYDTFQMLQCNLYLHVSFMCREVHSHKSVSHQRVRDRELTECVLSICCKSTPDRGVLFTRNQAGAAGFYSVLNL